jgi:phosphoribosylglycinamide formyltransferase-1
MIQGNRNRFPCVVFIQIKIFAYVQKLLYLCSELEKKYEMDIAVFASGTGTTLQTLIEKQSKYGYHIAQVITNRACQSTERAISANIPSLESKDWEIIDKTLGDKNIQLIVLAGFLAIIPQWMCEKWDKRIINIHPSLLPKHGGKGMYGIHVQEAVLQAQDKEAGCTVHYVSANIDGGDIIAQSAIDVMPSDTPETLAQRVQQEEKKLLPHVIGDICKTLNKISQ